MRWSQPRFGMRRLMVAIAILAIGFDAIKCVVEMRARSAAYWRQAVQFERDLPDFGSLISTTDGRCVNRYDDENDWLREDWAWRMEAKYLRLSYYPWLAAEPDPPQPRPVAHPRNAVDLPEQDLSSLIAVRNMRPPAWTFLWTWRWE